MRRLGASASPVPFGARTHRAELPDDLALQCSRISLLGVEYCRLKTSDNGDLYLTRYGLPLWKNLLPENWYAGEWFQIKRERLDGTSTIYKVPTRQVDGRTLHLVVRWSRVGEVVPLDTLTVNKFINAEFNSPFEEISLLMELRRGEDGPRGIRIRTQQPMAIYVPSERLQLWQTGRSEDKIRAKVARHPGVEIDILRQYVVIYRWVDGLDAVEMADRYNLDGRERAEFLARATTLAIHELWQKGYRVIDMKPDHIILRNRRDGSLLRDRNGQLVYALVDYELLERTPEHEQAVRSLHRQFYLKHMARRFDANSAKPLPAHLRLTSLLEVDYVFGRAESTGGLLWVVGKDPDLFYYFLPERWRRTPKRTLSSHNEVYYTRTKDDINLVWKVSRMGEVPLLNNPEAHSDIAQLYGFNTPFEEFAIALELARHGVKAVYPRAIYMTGRKGGSAPEIADGRRYAALSHLCTPDGEPALRKEYDYITIWGFWNGPDELLAAQDGRFYKGIDAERACADKLIPPEVLEQLMKSLARGVAICGFQDLNPKPDHLLISFDDSNKLVVDAFGKPEVRLCNFELIRRLPVSSKKEVGS